jgi:hypothetical protein
VPIAASIDSVVNVCTPPVSFTLVTFIRMSFKGATPSTNGASISSLFPTSYPVPGVVTTKLE